MSLHKEVTVPPQTKPIRLDKFLIQHFPETSRNFWKKNLEGLIKINGRPPKKGAILTGGECLTLQHEIAPQEPLTSDPSVKIPIIFEDPYFLVVEKPAGIPIHPLSSKEKGTLIQGVLAEYPEIREIGDDPREAGLVHRLDTGTSGLVLIARNAKTYLFFREEFQKHRVEKEYWALVVGALKSEVGKEMRIDLPILHHPKNKKKMKIARMQEKEGIEECARPAVTCYALEKRFKDFSLLRVRIPTGVRHQIRVHLSFLGYPIVGDLLYGGEQAKRSEFDRFFLHAVRLAFRHPKTLRRVEYFSDLPRDLKIFLDHLS